MLQTSNAIIIQPIAEEVSDKTQGESPTKCPTIKTKPVSLKPKIKDIHKRNSNENNTTPKENIKEANFVAHWVPERFISLVRSFTVKLKQFKNYGRLYDSVIKSLTIQQAIKHLLKNKS